MSIITWYFLLITLSLASVFASTSRNWPRPQGPGLSFGLKILALFNITGIETKALPLRQKTPK